MLSFAPRPLLAYSRRPRPLKASLRVDVRRTLDRIVALVPYVGAQVPEEAREVENFIRAILPAPPPSDGVPIAPVVTPYPATSLDLPHFLLSPELNVFMVSDTLEQALGIGQYEFRRHWRDHLEAADIDALQHDFAQAQETQEGFSERVHWRMADGSLRGSTLRITPRLFHGEFVGFTGILLFDQAA